MGVADLNQRWMIIAALVLINAAFAYVAWVPVCPCYSEIQNNLPEVIQRERESKGDPPPCAYGTKLSGGVAGCVGQLSHSRNTRPLRFPEAALPGQF